MKYLVINSYTPEYDTDSGIDLDYFDTLEEAKEYAKRIYKATIYVEVE